MDADGPLMEGPSSPEWILRQWILLKILGLLPLTAYCLLLTAYC